MVLAGDVKIGYDTYFFVQNETKSCVKYFLLAPEPVRGDSQQPTIRSLDGASSLNLNNYVIEIYKKMKVSGKVSMHGSGSLIQLLLDAMYYARTYVFRDEDITDNELDGGLHQYFSAQSTDLGYTFRIEDGVLNYVRIQYGRIRVELHGCPFRLRSLSEKDFQMQEASREQRFSVLKSTIRTITADDLENTLDMSWYRRDGVLLKNYFNVQSVYDFETRVFTPIVRAVLACREAGTPLVVTLDTETTGLNIYHLAADNPVLSHCVSIQLSWEEDQGAAVFVDMEHFLNLPVSYVSSRLQELFSWYEGKRRISFYEADHDSADVLQSLDQCTKVSAVLERKDVLLVGHNFPFDRRVMYQSGRTDIWFDADTCQMAFDLNPQSVRGNNKLKHLTRKIFGHETPELSDILGRGNEDKYKYLVDEEVANIYGCADVDYTRKLFFYLRNLMPEYMYRRYLQQDVAISNVLAVSEYYGVMTFQDKVQALAEETRQNLEILKNAAYEYVGAYMDYFTKRKYLEARRDAGFFQDNAEYEQAVRSIETDADAKYEFDFKASSLRYVLYDLLKYPIFGYTEGKLKLPKVDKFVIKKLLQAKRKDVSTARRLNSDILSYGTDRQEYEALKNGTPADRKKAGKMCLISAEEFNRLEHPLALIVREYADLNKEYTSYFKPIQEQNLEGKIFKGFNMARIETRRISNPIQTMKGNLKALVRSYSDDYYTLDFDMSQIEYRIMLSLAQFPAMIRKMSDPEKDYHTETASLVNSIPAHKVSKKVRKQTKSVSFGVPYGLGEMSLCDTMFGVINEDNMFSTRLILSMWKSNNHPIIQLLEEARDSAMAEWQISDEMRDFLDAWEKDKNGDYVLVHGKKVPAPVSRVCNKFGFYRIFSLKGIGQTPADVKRRENGEYIPAEKSIRRKAGNYPIQSFAAEIFRIILMRFYWRCKKEGIEDKILWHMLIHDELLCSVHKSLHPFYIYKLVKESCMITMKGHTKYFVGINIGDTWAECKDDSREAPVHFVCRMIKKWDNGDFSPEKTPAEFLKDGNPDHGYWFDSPWDFIKPYRERYVQDRIYEVVSSLINIDSGPVNVPHLLEKFDNYTVRAYVKDYPENSSVDKSQFVIGKDKDGRELYDQDGLDDAAWSASLETWALDVFGEGKEFIDSTGHKKKLCKKTDEGAQQLDEEFTDFGVLFDDSTFEGERNWSFDNDIADSTYTAEVHAFEYEEPDPLDDIDTSKSEGAASVAAMMCVKKPLQHLRLVKPQLIVNYESVHQMSDIKELLGRYRSSSGYTVVFRNSLGRMIRWLTISDQADLEMIDQEITKLASSTPARASTEMKNVQITNGVARVSVSSMRDRKAVMKLSSGTKKDVESIKLLVSDPFGRCDVVYISSTKLKELDMLVGKLR